MRFVLKLICRVRLLLSFGCLFKSWWVVSGIEVVEVLFVVMMLCLIVIVLGRLICFVSLLMMCMLVWCGMKVVSLLGVIFVVFSVCLVILVIF